jgi:hypothetical protein
MARGGAPFGLAKVEAALEALEETVSPTKGRLSEGSNIDDMGHTPRGIRQQTSSARPFDKRFADAKGVSGEIMEAASFAAEWPKAADQP